MARYVTVRYGSTRMDQRYVTVSYITLCYVKVENRHQTSTFCRTVQWMNISCRAQ